MNKINNYHTVQQPTNFNNWIDNFFNHSIGDVIGSDFIMNQASVNITELSDAFQIELAAPGLEKSDFDINIDKNKLSISIEKILKGKKQGGKYTRREFDFSSFKRSFQLREDIDTNEISASYENGILLLLLPKKVKEEIEKRIIEIS